MYFLQSDRLKEILCIVPFRSYLSGFFFWTTYNEYVCANACDCKTLCKIIALWCVFMRLEVT
jgi:hypothetical protein